MTEEEDEKMQLEYIEAYFDKRSPLPGKDIAGQENAPEPKSTLLMTCQICTTSAKDC